jgi:hypothetical protein
MPSVQDIRQGQELIRSLATDRDPSQGWDTRLQPNGVIDAATIAAVQVLLYLGEKRRPIPAGAHILLQPGTQSLWRATLEEHWPAVMDYLKTVFPRGFTKAAAMAIGITVAVTTTFLLGIRALARWEDRQHA